MEHTGPDAARPYVEQAGATFPTLVDQHGLTSQRFDFKVVPNGVLVDTDGSIRWAKFGGFSIDNPDDVAVVERFLTDGDPGSSPTRNERYSLDLRTRELIETKLRLGRLLDTVGRRDEAIREWRSALYLDPDNFVIRKQIWAALHPEKFHPTIDFDWQKVRLARER
ncbi:MAG: thioredoxin family protein, partial [Dehalococcoidia bacterium]